MVIVVGDDPNCHSSAQSEQNSRGYAFYKPHSFFGAKLTRRNVMNLQNLDLKFLKSLISR